jgi:nickel-dependent lactate racemase
VIVEVAFGAGRVGVAVPDDSLVVRPSYLPGLADPAAAIVSALRRPNCGPPLESVTGPRKRVVVVFPDITRPMPNRTVLPPLLEELERLGAGRQEVTLLCSTGTHRPASPAELEELIGPEIVSHYRVRQHVATDGDHVEVGSVDGVPVLLDRAYVEADLRIVTGFVEPHFFAGFSGGPKAVCPGVASLETILEAHSPARIADPRSTWTQLDCNPVHRFVAAATALLPPDLALDVAINDDRKVTAVFAGALPRSHRMACEFVERTSVQSVPQACDIVVSSNAGMPLDRNLYQAVKGMAAAERIVRPGGDVVMLSSCVDGIPDEGHFGPIVRAARSPSDLTDPRMTAGLDTWEAQVLGRVLSKATVHLYSEGLTDEQVREMHLVPVADPSQTVSDLISILGRQTTVCVLPEGPLNVATVAG